MAEDPATVLEQFIHDGNTHSIASPSRKPLYLLNDVPIVSNLPAEISHIFEEIQAKDRILKEQRDNALARDNSLQKHIKLHGSHVENIKEAVYFEQIRKCYERVKEIQEEKVQLAQKAVDLVERHMKRLDSKFGDLMRDGLMPPESILPSPYPKNLPVSAHATRQPSSVRASPMITAAARAPPQHPSAHPTPPIAPVHNTPVATPTAFPVAPSAPTPRDTHDIKRRRLTAPPNAIPVVSSNLASHPSTPGIRSEPTGQTRRSSTPNVQGLKKRRIQKREVLSEEDEDDEDDDLEEDAGEDKRLYCTCQQVSYGNMVACDDGDCPYEWFHWACVNLTKEPPGKWYCPTCTQRREKNKNPRAGA